MDQNVDPVVEKLAQAQRLYAEHKMRPTFDCLVESVFTLNQKVNLVASLAKELADILNDLGKKARGAAEVKK